MPWQEIFDPYICITETRRFLYQTPPEDPPTAKQQPPAQNERICRCPGNCCCLHTIQQHDDVGQRNFPPDNVVSHSLSHRKSSPSARVMRVPGPPGLESYCIQRRDFEAIVERSKPTSPEAELIFKRLRYPEMFGRTHKQDLDETPRPRIRRCQPLSDWNKKPSTNRGQKPRRTGATENKTQSIRREQPTRYISPDQKRGGINRRRNGDQAKGSLTRSSDIHRTRSQDDRSKEELGNKRRTPSIRSFAGSSCPDNDSSSRNDAINSPHNPSTPDEAPHLGSINDIHQIRNQNDRSKENLGDKRGCYWNSWRKSAAPGFESFAESSCPDNDSFTRKDALNSPQNPSTPDEAPHVVSINDIQQTRNQIERLKEKFGYKKRTPGFGSFGESSCPDNDSSSQTDALNSPGIPSTPDQVPPSEQEPPGRNVLPYHKADGPNKRSSKDSARLRFEETDVAGELTETDQIHPTFGNKDDNSKEEPGSSRSGDERTIKGEAVQESSLLGIRRVPTIVISPPNDLSEASKAPSHKDSDKSIRARKISVIYVAGSLGNREGTTAIPGNSTREGNNSNSSCNSDGSKIRFGYRPEPQMPRFVEKSSTVTTGVKVGSSHVGLKSTRKPKV